MRVILDCPKDRLETALGIAEDFMREYPVRAHGRIHGVGFWIRATCESFYAYYTKTGVVVHFTEPKK